MPAQPSNDDDTTSTAVPLPADSDRFIALAFCWADTLIELDEDLKILYAGGLTMAVAGLGPEQLTGRNIDDILMPGHRRDVLRLLDVARQCGRVDNVSFTFKGPDGDGVAVELAVHVLPELGGRSFLAMRLGGIATGLSGGTSQSDRTGLLDEDDFVGAARQALSRGGERTTPVLTLLAIPDIAKMCDRLDPGTFRNLSNTIGGFLRARAIGHCVAGLGIGRFGLVHGDDLDVERLESNLLSITNGFGGPDTAAQIESASIKASASLSEQTLGQVVVHAVRRFRETDTTGATLQQLRENLPMVAAKAAEMAKAFASLVDTRGFHIAFQPVVACDGGDILVFEGLARIDGRDGESPHKYICYAEETGQICNFDLAMAEKALEWLQSRGSDDIRVSINISSLSMLDPDFITRLHRILDAHPDCARLLAFEVTECSRVKDLDAINQLIQSLRQRGHLVGLDDFAAVPDGFRMLSVLDVDFVKFRPRTAATAAASAKSAALLKSLTGYCRETGAHTVATAVETAADLKSLRASGVEYVQGYLLGKPSPDIRTFQ